MVVHLQRDVDGAAEAAVVEVATHLSDTFFPLLVARRPPFVQLHLKTLHKLQPDLFQQSERGQAHTPRAGSMVS